MSFNPFLSNSKSSKAPRNNNRSNSKHDKATSADAALYVKYAYVHYNPRHHSLYASILPVRRRDVKQPFAGAYVVNAKAKNGKPNNWQNIPLMNFGYNPFNGLIQLLYMSGAKIEAKEINGKPQGLLSLAKNKIPLIKKPLVFNARITRSFKKNAKGYSTHRVAMATVSPAHIPGTNKRAPKFSLKHEIEIKNQRHAQRNSQNRNANDAAGYDAQMDQELDPFNGYNNPSSSNFSFGADSMI